VGPVTSHLARIRGPLAAAGRIARLPIGWL
jgi:hypothetical protein